MTFVSPGYPFFLAAVFLVFLLLGDRGRWLLLLLTSLAFYGTLRDPALLVALGAVTVLTYGIGLFLEDEARSGRRLLFFAGVAGNLLVLAFMKYIPVHLPLLQDLAKGGAAASSWQSFGAVGVSYFTFQAISYLADVYSGLEKPERHFGYFALYLAFFPKLYQGPIERAGDLLPQLKSPYRFDYETVRSGLVMILWGVFKKVVVAERLGVMVDTVYNHVHSYRGITVVLATYLYALQIYCDFSGYTDMALGSARLFNIRLTQNFAAPYGAATVADFWRRWHISFSRWILDYIFKPVQILLRYGRELGTAAALMVTFLASGLWHGATWGFVAWGALHGCYLSCGVLYRPYKKKLHRRLGLEGSRWVAWWQVFLTFNLVCFAWIFFRANTMDDALYAATHLFSPGNSGLGVFLAQQKKYDLLITALALPLVIWLHFRGEHRAISEELFLRPAWFRWSLYLGTTVAILLFRVDVGSKFIYFQF